MTAPRHVAPGKVYLIGRRTERRVFLLRPDPILDNAFLYCLGVFAPRYGVALHQLLLMSTHFHAVVTDVEGRLPEFLHAFDRSMALVVKEYVGWDGRVWDGSGPSAVELRTHNAIVEKHAYVLANPVEAGAVRFAREWPGLTTRLDELGKRTWTAKKPAQFFSQVDGVWPDEVTVRLEWCQALGNRAHALEQIRAERDGLEREARQRYRAKGWAFLGADRVRKCSPFRRSTTREPTRSLNPTFAVGRGQHEARLAASRARRAFLSAHRAALRLLRDGRHREAIFPHGTWMMVRRFGFPVAPPLELPTSLAA